MRGSPKAGFTREMAVFALAALPRIAYLLIFRPPFETTYWGLASSILQEGSLSIDGMKITDYEPLYPVFLAACRVLARDHVLVVQLLQIAVSSLGAAFLYRLALRLTSSGRVATISAVLFAFHPLLVRQSAAASDLALVSTLLVVFANSFVSIRRPADAGVAGLWLGLAILTRSMVLPVAVIGCVILAWQAGRVPAGAFVVAALLAVMPLEVRNHGVNGSWWPTRSGMNLFIGNSPYTSALLPDHDLDLLQDPAYALFARERPDVARSAPEYATALDAFLTRRALSYMMERPVATLGEKVRNVAYCFSPRLMPYDIAGDQTRVVIGNDGTVEVENSVARPRVEVVAHAVSSSFILVAAAAGVYLRRRRLRDDAILWAVVATFVAVNALYVPASRYAAPMQFVLLFYSGVALARVTKDAEHGSLA